VEWTAVKKEKVLFARSYIYCRLYVVALHQVVVNIMGVIENV
jgi:hypothetical protein